MRDLRVGVLFGGMSGERDVSLRTGRAISDALKRLGYQVIDIDAGADLPRRLVDERIEVAFIALHGPLGEDGTVQGMLEVMGIPYTGSGPTASAVAMDKQLARCVMQSLGVPVAPGFELAPRDPVVLPDAFGFPVVVKPVAQGSTLGIAVAHDQASLEAAVADARRYGELVLIEAYIDGVELTVPVLEGKVMPEIEIEPSSGFYDYHDKYTKGATRFHLPARINSAQSAECANYAIKAYRSLRCEGVARVDMKISSAGRVYVLEVNTIPGMTETSLVPQSAAKVGMSFESLCETLLRGARLKVVR